MQKKHDYDLSLMIPFMIHAFVAQLVTVLTRIDTSYRAIELQVPIAWYGIINSGYALLPIFLAVPVGRYIDRGNDVRIVWLGSLLALASNIGFWGWGTSGVNLLAFTVVGGIGHLCLMAGHQALTAEVVRLACADAIELLRRGGFLRQIEDIRRVVLHAPGEFVAGEDSFQLGVTGGFLELLGVQLLNEVKVPALFGWRELRVGEITNRGFGDRRAGLADGGALENGREKGVAVVARAAVAGTRAEADEGRQVVVGRAQSVADP